jgi:hypothetical protein
MNRLGSPVAVVILIATGCGDVASSASVTEMEDSAGIALITLTGFPSLAADVVMPVHVESGADVPIQRIDDARLLDDGRIAILDAKIGEVWMLDHNGAGRLIVGSGRGPGEAARPLAVIPAGRQIVVWDPGLRRLLVLDAEGQYVRSIRHPPGDSDIFRRRMDAKTEDYRLRVRWDGTDLWFHGEDNELELFDPSVRGTAEIPRRGYVAKLRYPEGMDTILVFHARTRITDRFGPSYGPPLFSGQQLWAVGRGLLAIARTDSAAVTIYDSRQGTPRAIVRWTAVPQQLTLTDRRRHARAYVREWFDDYPQEAHEAWSDEAIFNRHADRIPTAAMAPLLAAIELVGDCLWISPFDLTDNSDGVSRTWLWANIATGRSGTVTLDTAAVKPLHFAAGGIIARKIGSDGVHSVRRYALPSPVITACDVVYR